jgi:undecaprenyl-diphosphatase
MLARLGLPVATVEPIDVYAEVSHPFRATTETGRHLFVKVLDPDPRSTDWVLRVTRVFASRERRDISALASLPVAAEHEAVVTMAARSAGVRVPEVVLARGDGSAALVVLEEVPGHDLTALSSDDLTDEVLHAIWQQVATLHRARIAHRDMVRANVLLDAAHQPWLIDFREAEVGTSEVDRDGDVAELMASLAVVVGPARAVASAREVLGAEAVDRALADLELYALSPRTRHEMRDRPGLLDAVRAEAGGGPEATAGLLDVRRIWLSALVAAAGYTVLLTVAGWGAVGDALEPANDLATWTEFRWAGVTAVVVVAALLLLGYTIGLAAHRRIAIGRSAAAAAVGGSMEILGGPPARRHYLERYIRANGGRGDEPRTAVDLVFSAEVAAGLLVVVVAAGFGVLRGSFDFAFTLSTLWFALIAVAAVGAGLVIRKAMRGTWVEVPRGDTAADAIRAVRTSPGRGAAVLTAAAAVELALIVALAAAFRVLGPAEDLHVVALALAATHVALALLKVSGMPVVGEAACIAVLTVFGVAPATAVVAVLVYAVFRVWAAALVSVFAAPRLAPVHAPVAVLAAR